MGTNYYVEFDVCDECEKYHIGKSSGGWCFSLHVEPKDGIYEIDDVIRLCAQGRIVDEYGKQLTSIELMNVITKRKWTPARVYGGVGERTQKEFLNSHSAVQGPNGLVRYKIDGSICIGHGGGGSGTWDLIVGEFS